MSTSSKDLTILDEALQSVKGARQENYGSPKDNFNLIATHWSNHLGYPISAQDVAIMMILLKVARLKNTHTHRDSIVDVAGYAYCLELIND